LFKNFYGATGQARIGEGKEESETITH